MSDATTILNSAPVTAGPAPATQRRRYYGAKVRRRIDTWLAECDLNLCAYGDREQPLSALAADLSAALGCNVAPNFVGRRLRRTVPDLRSWWDTRPRTILADGRGLTVAEWQRLRTALSTLLDDLAARWARVGGKEAKDLSDKTLSVLLAMRGTRTTIAQVHALREYVAEKPT